MQPTSDDDVLFGGDDYRPKPPSPRELAAREVASLLTSHGVRADEPERSGDRRCWRFKVYPAGVQAAVEVFNDSYIRVSWAYLYGEPASRVYETVIEAVGFLYAAFVLGDMRLAQSIPTRPWKGRKAAKQPEQGFPFDG